MIRRARAAALATVFASDDAKHPGWPYASLVTLACGCDASPILLLSDLSEHSRNLKADARCSLLIEEASRLANPQTGARVTVIGRLKRTKDPALRRRFLARHPAAGLYADFADFHVYRMDVERAHYVGGFGRAAWIEGRDLTLARRPSAALVAAEPGVLAHMNTDHAEDVRLYATALLGRRGEAWQMIGVDPEGLDLRLGSFLARLEFDRPVGDEGALRKTLMGLAAEARARGR